MSARVIRSVYRELLRHAKLMDNHAAVKALLSRAEVPENFQCQKAISSLLGENKVYYLPHTSAAEVLRRAFRSSTGDLGAAFLALRFMGEKLHVARQYGLLKESPFLPTRTYELLSSPSSASPPSSPVALTKRIRSGVFLIAHPMLYRPFEQTVVLVTSHSAVGTTGFIVNEKAGNRHTLWPNYGVDTHLKPLFGSHQVHYGGPVGGGSVQFLHAQPNIGGTAVNATSLHDSSPLFVGGNLMDFAKLPNSNPNEVVFFNGYAGWTPQLLQKELDVGSWIMVTAPLSMAIRSPAKNLWRYLLKQLGSEYDQFAAIPRNVDFTVHVS
ncbi:hypothetical protein H310_06777 [Aphanomyces invadans]|uniref:Uncharacterized protein n=1 Tax=Aphanomyces invadans TaxID=157072 RepID=A0A024U4K1_9STRA|nr:hypothetical protein H310_06777 [Aphanomyces invadans]ETW01179.1 hypothetical protein H310_06777 [Aphanomyces invadans]|eukprot:XP_008870177.1 hypothetical protein H310_06777 [Aphanomyces invadans]